MICRRALACTVLIIAQINTASPLTGQTVIESRFLPDFGSYSRPENWTPAEVPNKTADRHYNVTANSLNVDVDATISNLTLADGEFAGLQVLDRTFVVEQTTAAVYPRVSVVASNAPSSYGPGALSALVAGSLAGEYSVTA